jgi:hypothetical protein
VIEQAILEILRAHAPLLALMGGDPKRIDLCDVAQGTEPPYLTFNFAEASRAGRGSLCDPASLGLLMQALVLQPWAPTAPLVVAINTAARVALVGGPRSVASAAIQSIGWAAFKQWAREPETNLLTRAQVLTVHHTE